MLDSFTIRRIQSVMNGYIHEKVPAPLRTMVKLTYEMNDNELILTEERPAEKRYQWNKMPIARFNWEEHHWKVYAKGEHSSWDVVEVIEPCPDFEELLEQVEGTRQEYSGASHRQDYMMARGNESNRRCIPYTDLRIQV